MILYLKLRCSILHSAIYIFVYPCVHSCLACPYTPNPLGLESAQSLVGEVDVVQDDDFAPHSNARQLMEIRVI